MMTMFYGKTWIFWTQAVVFGGLGFFAIICGPLFLAKVMVPANGADGFIPGVALSFFGVFFLSELVLVVINIAARAQPLIRFHNRGIEIRVIGATGLDAIPMPAIARIALMIALGLGFRTQIVEILCDNLTGVFIRGVSLSKSLEIQFDNVDDQGKRSPRRIVFQEVEFKDSLDDIARAIREHCHLNEKNSRD